MGNPVFAVVVTYLDTEKSGFSRIKRTRTWGFFHQFKDAEQCVLENWTDIFEAGFYNYAVVNEMPEGVCVIPKSQVWFKCDYEADDHLEKYKVYKVENPLNGERINLGW